MVEGDGHAASTADAPRELETPHFRLRFAPGSYAERNLPQLQRELETLYATVVEALDLSDLPSERIEVVLTEFPLPRDGSGREEAHPRRGAVPWGIEVVYRADAPGAELGRSLIGLLVRRALGLRSDRVAGLLDGVEGYLALREGQVSSGDLAAVTLEEGPTRLGEMERLLSIEDDEARRAHQLLVTALTAFLIERYGLERFREWLRQTDLQGPGAAARAVYPRSLVDLEREWHAAARKATAPLSLFAFLKLSFRYLRPYWVQQMLILVALLITLAFTTLLPLSYTVLIDQAIVPGDRGLLALVLGGLGVLFIIQTGATLGDDYLTAWVSARVMNDMRTQLLTHLQRLSMGFHTRSQVGDLMSMLSSDLASVEMALTRVATVGLYLILSFTVSSVLIFFLEWRLALVAFATLPIFVIGPRIFGPRAARASLERAQDGARLASAVQENLGAQAVIKAFGLRDTALAQFREHMNRIASSGIRLMFLGSLLGTTVSLSASFVQLLILGIGAFMVINGQLMLGVLLAFLGLLGNVISPLQQLSGITQALQQATGAMQRINGLLATAVEVEDAADAQSLPRPRGDVQLDDVTFAYTKDQTILRDLSLTIAAGESVAFVGPSGCGKSTVLNLIVRFYDPTSGSVIIDGRDTRQLTQESLRQHMGVVFQDTFLFNTTIRENIRLGKLSASDEEVEAAARAAEIHELIASQSQGYDSVVGERGARLSGGQRQRMAIARAILRDPAILLLDEATSALDPQTEAAVNATLDKLAPGRTTVSVTHRLTSAMRADRIFVLDRGSLVESGTHAELLERQGTYARMWHQQHGVVTGSGGQMAGGEAARLQAVPLFENLDGILLAALASRFVTERYAEGATIFEAGAAGDKLYVIVRGQVEVLAKGPGGRERSLAVLRDGDYFGEIALLEDVARTATIRARVPTVVLALDRQQFVELLDSLPDLRAAFDEVVAARRRATLAVLAASAS